MAIWPLHLTIGMASSMSRRVLPLAIGATALLFSVLYVVHFTLVQDLSASSGEGVYLDTVVLGVPVIVLSAGALYFRGQSVGSRHVPRVLGWCFGGGLLATVVIVLTVFVAGAEFDAVEPLVLLHAAGGLGCSVGLVMGVLEFRAIAENQARARAEWEARQTAREREQVKLLNKYLRHEVLNNVQVINASAELVSDRIDADPDTGRRIEGIRERSNDIAQFVQSIRRILDASDYTLAMEAVDVTGVVETELTKVERTHEAVSVCPPEIDDAVFVQADSLISTVFVNLFENATEHNDGPIRLDVSVVADDDTVSIYVADDGSGIDPAERDGLFEPSASGDHGYGLFLSQTLVRLYGGSLSLAGASEFGTTFRVTLQAAEADHPSTGATLGAQAAE